MLILAMDTATSAITVAVASGEAQPVVASRIDPRGHTEHLAPMIADTLAAAGASAREITDIVVGVGPGPFTGLRVGLVTAVTMGDTLGVPVHGVPSLDAIAAQVALGDGAPKDLLVASDARRREVYVNRYALEGGTATAAGEPWVAKPADLAADVRALPTAGRGPLLYPEAFPNPVDVLDVDAGVLARLGAQRIAAGGPMPTAPLYLRRPDAATLAERAAR